MLVNPNQSDVSKEFAAGARHLGDVVTIKPGTLLWDTRLHQIGTLPLLQAHNLSLYGPGVTFRPVTWAYWNKIDLQHIVVMDSRGDTGAFSALPKAEQDAINAIISAAAQAGTPIDYTPVVPAADALIHSFPDITESLLDIPTPASSGEITYNGKSFILPVHWTSGVSKGLFTVKVGIWGTFIEGFVFDNASGGSDNGAGIRTQGTDIWVRYCEFNFCQDGILGNSPMGPADPNGAFYTDSPAQGRFNPFGFAVSERNKFRRCGSDGLAHSDYMGHTVMRVEWFSEAWDGYAGNVFKFVGSGVELAVGCKVHDSGQAPGILEPFDMTSGYCAVYNSEGTKASMGTGNSGPVMLVRNNRNPLSTWQENACIARGNTFYILFKHGGSYWVEAVNSPTFNTGGTPTWPGVPSPIRAVVRDNVFVTAPGLVVNHPPAGLPAGADVGNNQFFLAGDTLPDPRISMPNGPFNRATLREIVCDILGMDANIKPGLIDAIRAAQTYPPGTPPIVFFETKYPTKTQRHHHHHHHKKTT